MVKLQDRVIVNSLSSILAELVRHIACTMLVGKLQCGTWEAAPCSIGLLITRRLVDKDTCGKRETVVRVHPSYSTI